MDGRYLGFISLVYFRELTREHSGYSHIGTVLYATTHDCSFLHIYSLLEGPQVHAVTCQCYYMCTACSQEGQ